MVGGGRWWSEVVGVGRWWSDVVDGGRRWSGPTSIILGQPSLTFQRTEELKSHYSDPTIKSFSKPIYIFETLN